MQAIITRFVPCTNFRPSRVSARCEAGSIILSWDDGLDGVQNHAKAANALCAKLGWNDVSVETGCAKDFYVHTLKRIQKRLFVFAVEKCVVSRLYGGSNVTVRIYEAVEGPALRFLCRANWCTSSYKGNESEVMESLARNGHIPSEFTGYFSRYDMPFCIEGI